MADQLILVRHSLPEIDPLKPASSWGLSAEGRRRCLRLAEELSRHGPDLLVSSVEPKALETAQIVGEQLNLPLAVVQGLHEHERETVRWMDATKFRRLVVATLRAPQRHVFGEETGAQARDRFAGAVAAIRQAHPGKTIAVVTHGTVMALYLAHVCGIDPVPFWQGLELPDLVVVPDVAA